MSGRGAAPAAWARAAAGADGAAGTKPVYPGVGSGVKGGPRQGDESWA
jgi:hypothetical protein